MACVLASARFLWIAELSGITQWVVLAAAVVGTGIVLFKPKFKAKRDPLRRTPADSKLSHERTVERQMQNLLVELSEMARQVTAGLDTRAAKLDALIREADDKIALLSRLQELPAQANVARQASPEFAPVLAESNMRIGPDLPAPSPYDADPRHAEIYSLADQGQSVAEIAGLLQRPTGEVQLILALRARSS